MARPHGGPSSLTGGWAPGGPRPTVKALLPPELEFLLEHGAQGQSELARRFAEAGEAHLSHVRRRPTV